jgi:hypothetical protein
MYARKRTSQATSTCHSTFAARQIGAPVRAVVCLLNHHTLTLVMIPALPARRAALAGKVRAGTHRHTACLLPAAPPHLPHAWQPLPL